MRAARMFLLVMLVTAPCLTTVRGAEAAESKPIPLTINCANTPGLQINAPGAYTLTTAVTGCAASTIIEITASNVSLNLAGRLVEGNGANSACVAVNGSDLRNVTIANGTVARCADGIDVEQSEPATVKNVVVRSTGDDGIDGGEFTTVSRSTVVGAGGDGIRAGHIEDSVATNNGAVGIVVSNDSGSALRNVAMGNSGEGIIVNDTDGGEVTTVSHNTVMRNGSNGIRIKVLDRATGNTIVGNHGVGVLAQNNNRIKKNKITGNAFGIDAEDENTIVSNVVTATGDTGIRINADDNVISKTAVENNTTNANEEDGILFVDPIDDATTTLSKNTSNGNRHNGIVLAGGGNPGGSGSNHAAGNILSQCPSGLCKPPLPVPDATVLTFNCANPFASEIQEPGTYTIDTSLANCASSAPIAIETDDVTLDLGGRFIDGTRQLNQSCIKVIVPDVTNVRIKNGTVTDCGTGVNIDAAVRSSVTNFTVRGPSLDGAVGIRSGNDNVVDKTAVIDLSESATGIQAGNDGEVTRNVIAWESAHDSVNILGADRNTISGNTISGGGVGSLGGIIVANNNTVQANLVDQTISVLDDNTIAKNVAVNARVTVENGNSVVSNRIVGNEAIADALFAKDRNTIAENTIAGNRGAGLKLDDDPPAFGNNLIASTLIRENSLLGNGGHGIAVADPVDPATTAIKNNVANGNGGQGIHLDFPIAPQGGGTNTAAGNVQNPQCDENLCN